MTDDLTLVPKKKVDAEITKFTLNGTDVSGTSVAIYSPITSGTAEQILISGGSGEPPVWKSSITTNAIISKTNVGVRRDITTDRLTMYGGTDYQNGALLRLGGKDYSDLPGGFSLYATNGSKAYELIGTSAGSLTWGGVKVTTEEDIRFGGQTVTANGFKFIFRRIGRMVVVNVTGTPTVTTEISASVPSGWDAIKIDSGSCAMIANNYGQGSDIRLVWVSEGTITVGAMKSGISSGSNFRGQLVYIKAS